MKKAVYTVNIGNYIPDISAITVPAFKAYAERIGADFIQITERKFSPFAFGYEKMQIYELGKDYDYNVYFDLDVIISPKMFDVTDKIPADVVGHLGGYGADTWFGMDENFLNDLSEQSVAEQMRDAQGHPLFYANNMPVTTEKKVMLPRFFACCDRILCVPKACHEVWKPCELEFEEALVWARREHFIAEWNIARNMAKNHYKEQGIESPGRSSGAQSDDDVWINLNITSRATKNIDIQKLSKYAKEGL